MRNIIIFTTHFFLSLFFLCIREKSTVIYSNDSAAAALMMQFQKIFCIHNAKALFFYLLFPLISIHSLECILLSNEWNKRSMQFKNADETMNVTFVWLYSSHCDEPNEFRKSKTKTKNNNWIFICIQRFIPNGARRYFTPINVPDNPT